MTSKHHAPEISIRFTMAIIPPSSANSAPRFADSIIKARKFSARSRHDLTPTCNGYVLAPWPNRIENGEYDFNGKHYCAPVNE